MTLLHRTDPDQNAHRFYLVMVGSSLLDDIALLRIWGRIGGHQHRMVTRTETVEEAKKLADKLIRLRLKHGYQIVQGEIKE